MSDMIYIRRNDVPYGDTQIRALEEELREADPELGETWTGIMDYWEYANREMPINAALPDDLPQDDSLAGTDAWPAALNAASMDLVKLITFVLIRMQM